MLIIVGVLMFLGGLYTGLVWADQWHQRQALTLTMSQQLIKVQRLGFFGRPIINRFSASIFRRQKTPPQPRTTPARGNVSNRGV